MRQEQRFFSDCWLQVGPTEIPRRGHAEHLPALAFRSEAHYDGLWSLPYAGDANLPTDDNGEVSKRVRDLIRPAARLRDLVPVASSMRVPNVMDVSPTLPVKTVPEVIAYAKANPGRSCFILGHGHDNSHVRRRWPESNILHVPYLARLPVYRPGIRSICRESQEISDELSQLRRSTSLNKSCPRNHQGRTALSRGGGGRFLLGESNDLGQCTDDNDFQQPVGGPPHRPTLAAIWRPFSDRDPEDWAGSRPPCRLVGPSNPRRSRFCAPL